MKLISPSQALDELRMGKDNTINGECTGCGECCSNFLPLSDADISRIKKYISRNRIKAQVHTMPTAIPTMDCVCPFLDISRRDKKCTIYPVRPDICKAFKCNDPLDVVKHKELYEVEHTPVNVRETFYG